MSVLPTNDTAEVTFLGRKIGNPVDMGGKQARHRALIVAELGINHDGSAETAHKMIDVAAACGVDVVKLQKRDLGALIQPRFLLRPETAPGGLINYLPVLRKCELPDEAYPGLKAHAEEKGLGFLVTPFDEPSVGFLELLGVGAYKVASCDATNPFLLGAVAATGKPMLVSTGMTTEAEVWRLFNFLTERAPGRFGLMHAVSGYPVAFADCQLHMMLRYKHGFRVPVGWSGHERGVAVSLGAVAAGADVLERHFTLDRSQAGPDHAASLEPDGLKKLVERVRAFEAAYGDPYMTGKRLTRGETATHEVLGKSLCWREDRHAGHVIALEDFEARSPGRGLPPVRAYDLVGKSLSKPVRRGDAVDPEHFMVGTGGVPSPGYPLTEAA